MRIERIQLFVAYLLLVSIVAFTTYTVDRHVEEAKQVSCEAAGVMMLTALAASPEYEKGTVDALYNVAADLGELCGDEK